MTPYRTLQLVLLGFLGVMFGLSALARRFPQIGRLQAFRLPELTPEQKVRLRRRMNIQAGIELILLGIVIPMAYVATTIMFFSAFETTATVLVAAASVLCIGLGLTAIWKNRRLPPTGDKSSMKKTIRTVRR